MVNIPGGGLPGGKLGALGAVVVLVGVAGLIGVAVIEEDDEQASSSTTTTSVTTAIAVPTTSLTTTAPGPNTTSVAAASSTSAPTTTRPPTTSTTRAPTTTTVVAGTACGSGRAAVNFVAKDLATDALSSSLTPQAVVDNQVSAPIQVEELVVEIVYPGNDVRVVRFATAGTVIGPGTSASFTAERISTTKRYDSARFTRFTYFTEGQPTACRVTTP